VSASASRAVVALPGALLPTKAAVPEPVAKPAVSSTAAAPPGTGDPAPTQPPEPKREAAKDAPAAGKAPPTPSATNKPPGLPYYTAVEPNLAVGGQPTAEGLRWLKQRGFRTVLNLRAAPTSDEAATARQLGLQYRQLPVKPDAITRDLVERFNTLADDAAYRPLYIHDESGAVVGALWYMHRVIIDKASRDQAKKEAAAIGLSDSHKALWSAIDTLLPPVQSGR
jgi:protein tyrosine phosphatase (PTP) superfamily phosphohydrolase (DUF442 family)